MCNERRSVISRFFLLLYYITVSLHELSHVKILLVRNEETNH